MGKENKIKGNKPMKMVDTKKKAKIPASIMITLCASFLILAVMIGYLVYNKSPELLKKTVAVTVGEEQVDALEFRYHYNKTISNFVSANSYYLSLMGVDFTKSLTSQQFSDTQTWADYLANQATVSLTQLLVLKQEAEKNSFTSDELDSKIDEYMVMLKDAAKSYNMSAAKYITASYGEGIKEADIREYLKKEFYASLYNDKIVDSIDVTDTEIDDYYSSNKLNYDTATFRSFVFNFTEVGDETYATAKELADSFMTAVTDEASINTNAIATLTDEEKAENEGKDITLSENIKGSALNETIAAWMFEEGRQYGDKTIIEANNAFNFIFYIDSGLDDYNLVSVRHILIGSETENAEEKANQLYEEWKNGDATEDSFAALAEANSEDSGSSSVGGIYEDITKGYMVAEFNDWIFEEGRKTGDTGIITTSNGYHIMYFVGEGDPYWRSSIKNTITNNKYSDLYAEMSKNYTVSSDEDSIMKAIR